MQLPTLTTTAPTGQLPGITPAAAAARLGLDERTLAKLTDAHLLPLMSHAVESMARRPWLQLVQGEITVLRTSPKCPAPEEDARDMIGFDLADDDHTIHECCLRWWRCNRKRVRRNGLFAVTVATVPVAIFEITEHLETIGSRTDQRHAFAGQLLARIIARDQMIHYSPAQVLVNLADDDFLAVATQPHPRLLQRVLTTIMGCRISSNSGGPIAYKA